MKTHIAGKAPDIELNDGNKIPVVALGTGRKTEADEFRQAVLWAIEEGYRHIDTAALYENEPQVGRGIADAIAKGLVKRDDLFITTKLWNDRHAQDQVVPALRESLERLGLDYVDLYLIHCPVAQNADGSPSDIDYAETWRGMEVAKTLGLAKSIGVSNFNSSQLDRLFNNSQIKPAVNQIEVNPTMTQVPLVSHCHKLGIAVMACSPLGFLVSRENKNPPPPHNDDPILVAIADQYGKSTSQVVLRYLLERGLIIIPSSTNQKRLAQNLDLFDFKLTAEEVATIGQFNKNVRVVNATILKDFPNYPFES
ncbi:aldo-keto reductase AKR2E4-like isoform X2 [Cydia pomonella]|uniref:aldo-keto reductase AKR2E4-like isoform X2 n=1 Tax=Cydia pomonella TaxID=82600 RepID=UPI002ADE7361|nr:aldo-keto reductase AKR2E4-like isoform X2 [Cydia pomonella]